MKRLRRPLLSRAQRATHLYTGCRDKLAEALAGRSGQRATHEADRVGERRPVGHKTTRVLGRSPRGRCARCRCSPSALSLHCSGSAAVPGIGPSRCNSAGSAAQPPRGYRPVGPCRARHARRTQRRSCASGRTVRWWDWLVAMRRLPAELMLDHLLWRSAERKPRWSSAWGDGLPRSMPRPDRPRFHPRSISGACTRCCARAGRGSRPTWLRAADGDRRGGAGARARVPRAPALDACWPAAPRTVGSSKATRISDGST